MRRRHSGILASGTRESLRPRIVANRLAIAFILPAILCAGCKSPGRDAPSEPVAGLKRARERVAYTSEQLGQIYLTNLTFGDWYLARLAAACDALAQDAPTPEIRLEALRLKAAQGVSVSSILTGPHPILQVLSLQVLIDLTRMKWIDEGKAKAVFADRASVLIDALNELQERERSHALAVISENELDAIHDAARRWRATNPGIGDVEFIRFEDFATEVSPSLAQKERADFMSTLQNTSEGISDIWLLGARALYLMSRYPRIMQWQIEAQTAELATRSETKSLFGDLGRIADTTDGMERQMSELRGTLEEFPQQLAESLASGRAVKDALASLDRAATRGDSVAKQLAALDGSVRSLSAATELLAKQLEVVNKAYDPAAVQKMAEEVKLTTAHEVRSLIYLGAGCLVALVLLNAVLHRRARRSVS